MDIDINKTAQLAALQVSASEAEKFSQQLPQIFSFFEQINNVNTKGVDPLVTPTEMKHVLRSDSVVHWEDPKTAVSCASETSGNLFKVPPVV